MLRKVLATLMALFTMHPALAGQNIYKSHEIQDKQIMRLIGAHRTSRNWHCNLLSEKDTFVWTSKETLGALY